MAPELLSWSWGDAGSNAAAKSEAPAADIFSFGIMLFEMAADHVRVGELPLDGVHWHDLREGRIPPLSSPAAPPSSAAASVSSGATQAGSYSTALESLIHRMMDPDACKRPSAADILRDPHVATQAACPRRFIASLPEKIFRWGGRGAAAAPAAQRSIDCAPGGTPTASGEGALGVRTGLEHFDVARRGLSTPKDRPVRCKW